MSQQSKLIKGMSKKQNPINIVVNQTLVQKQKINIQRTSKESPSQEKKDEKD
jgi:hypothetical protein